MNMKWPQPCGCLWYTDDKQDPRVQIRYCAKHEVKRADA